MKESVDITIERLQLMSHFILKLLESCTSTQVQFRVTFETELVYQNLRRAINDLEVRALLFQQMSFHCIA